ncbi:MAG: hypothetical protein DME55_08720 [Verrucomicrobia bacterium]|nr:MAG: hypothetical protein DME55_08720 [Verrucomicrobiota bacterium]
MRETGCWIRDAELNDAPELAALMCELGYETKAHGNGDAPGVDFVEPGLQNLCLGHGRLRLRDDWHGHISKL